MYLTAYSVFTLLRPRTGALRPRGFRLKPFLHFIAQFIRNQSAQRSNGCFGGETGRRREWIIPREPRRGFRRESGGRIRFDVVACRCRAEQTRIILRVDSPTHEWVCSGAITIPVLKCRDARQPELQPREIGFRPEQFVRRDRLSISAGVPCLDDFSGRGGGENEAVASARKRDVKQSHLLAQRVATLTTLGNPMRQARVMPIAFRGHDLRTNTQRGVQQHVAGEVLEIKHLRQVRQRDDWKLQPLAFVDAHQAHSIRAGGRRGFLLRIGVALRLHKVQKAHQPLTLVRIKLACEIQQTIHIRAPLLTARHREQHRLVVRIGQHGFQTIRDRTEPREITPRFKRRVKRFQLGQCCLSDGRSGVSKVCLLETKHLRRRPDFLLRERRVDDRQLIE